MSLRLESKHFVAAVAVVCVVALEGVALATNHDGVMFGGTLALLGSILGAVFGVRLTRGGSGG